MALDAPPTFGASGGVSQIWDGRGGHSLDAVMARLEIYDVTVSRHTAPGDVPILTAAVWRMWRRLSPAVEKWPVGYELGCLPA